MQEIMYMQPFNKIVSWTSWMTLDFSISLLDNIICTECMVGDYAVLGHECLRPLSLSPGSSAGTQHKSSNKHTMKCWEDMKAGVESSWDTDRGLNSWY